MNPVMRSPAWLALWLVLAGLFLLALGVTVGSDGWAPPRWQDAAQAVVLDIRLPRSAGAWLAGALLGLAGAVAQGLFRNPLADPYLLGSASGAAFGLALLLAFAGAAAPSAYSAAGGLGLTGAAFAGAVAAVLITVGLARGVQHTLRLLLAGVIVGMVFGALTALLTFRVPGLLRSVQGFLLGSTTFMGWTAVALLGLALALCLMASLGLGRALDALTLGESTAMSLGVPLAPVRAALVGVVALATGAAVAQVGLVAFIGLMAPHLVRGLVKSTHGWLLPLSALTGGVLLLSADVLGRWLMAPQELPVGVLTAVLGGGYLLWLLWRGSW